MQVFTIAEISHKLFSSLLVIPSKNMSNKIKMAVELFDFMT